MLGAKLPQHDRRPETPRGIQTPARKRHAAQLRDEEAQADSYGRQGGRGVFLPREQEDGEEELGCEEGFN